LELNLRINVSNLDDVGQMRRRSGISMKMITKAHTLSMLSAAIWRTGMGVRDNVQADNAECNDEGGMEDV
jgi:hypothetical protein